MSDTPSLLQFLHPGVRVTLSHGITGRFVGWKNATTLRVLIDGDPDEATFHTSWLRAVKPESNSLQFREWLAAQYEGRHRWRGIPWRHIRSGLVR